MKSTKPLNQNSNSPNPDSQNPNSQKQNQKIKSQDKQKKVVPAEKIITPIKKGVKLGEKAGIRGVELAGKGVEIAGQGVEIAGKSVKLVGKGVQAAGRGVELAGQGVETIGQMAEKTGKEGVGVAVKFVKKRRNIRDYFWISKSGTITGAADNDPAGIVTYTQVGALSGISLLWLPLITLPMLVVAEEISARIGVVTKKGLNRVIADNFGAKIAFLIAIVLIVCNVATIGADIAGMGQIAGVITNTHWILWVFPILGLLAYLLISKNYQTVSRFLLILTPILLLYIIAAFILHPDWRQILHNTFIPNLHLDEKTILIAVAAIGTTISPYLLFWETTEEIEDKKSVTDLKKERGGVTAGMTYSQIIFYFIVLAAALAFYGKNTILDTPQQAALALKPVAGNGAFILFSIGILGSGLLAIPILAATVAYVCANTFGWKAGLDQKRSQAGGFYLVLVGSLLMGALIAILGVNPIKMLVYSQVLDGFLVPFLLIMLMLISSNSKIMGKYTNSIWTNLVGWLTVLAMIGLNVYLTVKWLAGFNI